jgi:DNA-binding NarL/FixJ family response regulator
MRTLLSHADDIKVVGAAADAQETIELAKQFKPNIIILDISLRPMRSVQLIEQIRPISPASQSLYHPSPRRIQR